MDAREKIERHLLGGHSDTFFAFGVPLDWIGLDC